MTDSPIVFEPEQEYTFDPTKNPLQLICCDCSLTHTLYFKVNKNRTITFSLEVDEEETDRQRNNPQIKEEAFRGIKMNGKQL